MPELMIQCRKGCWEKKKGSRNCRSVGRSPDDRGHLFGLFAEESDQIVAVFGLLKTTEGHLSAGNVLFRVF